MFFQNKKNKFLAWSPEQCFERFDVSKKPIQRSWGMVLCQKGCHFFETSMLL